MDVRTSQVIQTVPSQGHVPHQLISLSLVQMEDKNKTIMDYGDPIYFTFFAVNGAGNGSKANFTYLFKKHSGYYLCFPLFQLGIFYLLYSTVINVSSS